MDINNSIFDPWVISQKFIFTEGSLEIFGPYSKIHEKRFVLKFIYEKIDGYYNLRTIHKTNSYNNISIKFYSDKKTEISNINKSEWYSGSEYVLLALQILYYLQIKKCFLYDYSTIQCKREINYFKSLNNHSLINKIDNINFKIVSLLKDQITFYMRFNFTPYIDNNCIIDKMNDLLDKLYIITWNDINDYMENIKILIDKKNNSSLENNFFNYRIYDKNRWKIFWNNIYNSWIMFYEKYYIEKRMATPFFSFDLYNVKDCKYFINWLEIYNLSMHNYNSEIFNKRFNINIGQNEFKELVHLSNKAIYILDNIKLQKQM